MITNKWLMQPTAKLKENKGILSWHCFFHKLNAYFDGVTAICFIIIMVVFCLWILTIAYQTLLGGLKDLLTMFAIKDFMWKNICSSYFWWASLVLAKTCGSWSYFVPNTLENYSFVSSMSISEKCLLSENYP